MVDSLSAIFDKAREDGHLKGVVSHLISGGVTHLQYGDDTILLFQPDLTSITTVKIMLICFEAMSGMKINYNKSEVISIGM